MLIQAQPSCSCTSAIITVGTSTAIAIEGRGDLQSLPTIAPGQQFTVRVSIDPAELTPGPTIKSVSLFVQGQAQPVAILQMTGTLFPILTCDPTYIDFSKANPAQDPPQRVMVSLDSRLVPSGHWPTLTASDPDIQITPLAAEKPNSRQSKKPVFLKRTYLLRLYSQFGEDIIAASVFWYLHNTKPLYLDIGAYAPASLSNTFYFYKRGSSGVCVEANPRKMAAFRRARRRDTCLNAGIGVEDKASVPFYVLDPDALSTFSEESAREHERTGHARIRSVAHVPIYSINTLLEKYFPRCPEFLSIDVEGLDFAILQSLDFDRYRPTLICVETIDYYTHKKNMKVAEFLLIDLSFKSRT